MKRTLTLHFAASTFCREDEGGQTTGLAQAPADVAGVDKPWKVKGTSGRCGQILAGSRTQRVMYESPEDLDIAQCMYVMRGFSFEPMAMLTAQRCREKTEHRSL
jgi:hypothetical protein